MHQTAIQHHASQAPIKNTATEFIQQRQLNSLNLTSMDVLWIGSGTVDRKCERAPGGCWCICAGQTMSVHSPDGSTFLREKTSWLPSWKCDAKSKIWLRQSYTKFHLDPIWNDAALGCFEQHRPQQEEQQEEHSNLQYGACIALDNLDNRKVSSVKIVQVTC